MAIEKGPIVRRPMRWVPDLRMSGWLATVLLVALVLLAGGVGGLVMAEITGKPLQVQFPGNGLFAGGTAPDSIRVTGVGSVVAAPDTIYADVGANVIKANLPQALSAMTDDSTKLVAALKNAGVADVDIQTTGLNAWTRTDSYSGAVTGYDASVSLRVRIRDVNKATAILNAAAAAIGNDIRFNGLQYTRTDIGTQAAQARQQALKAASDRASAIAQASNRQLGKILAVSEDYVTYMAPGMAGGMGGGQGGGGGYVPSIQTGQGEVVVQLSVTYSIS